MRIPIILLTAALSTPLHAGNQAATPSETVIEPAASAADYGTFSGRVQLLGMHRDFDNGNNGHSTTLGAVLQYASPNFHGFDMGLAYNYAFTLYDGGNTYLLINDDINLLNEAWVRYNFEGTSLEESDLLVGRKVVNGEIFRKDDFRQKARAVETVQFTTDMIPDTKLTLGHAIRMSNWIQVGDRANFNDFGDVFGTGYDTDGVTWGEAIYSGFDAWEISVFDAYAWDVANLIGTRIQYEINDNASLIGYYRHEGDVGRALSRKSDAWGVSYQQKICGFALEPGFFSVHGDGLLFNEATTGINHALGASMLIFGKQYTGGADTAYIKATTKVGKTVLYALYNYTWQDKLPFDGQELNVVVKHPITDCLTVCLKGGLGRCDGKLGTADSTATDARIFVTYTF